MRRIVVILFSLAMVALVVWPVTTSPPRDSFPLSNYPMFARDRPTETTFATVVAVDADGTVVRLSPAEIGGTDQVIQAAATVSRAVRADDADALCAEVIDRLGDDADANRRLEVISERYDTVAWFDGDETPIERTVHATCGSGS